MNRIEMVEFLEKEQELALKWYENTKIAAAESERLLEDMKKYLKSKDGRVVTSEELKQYEELKALVKDANSDLVFYDGVRKGVEMVSKQIRERMAFEELSNAGRWIPKPIKPRRR